MPNPNDGDEFNYVYTIGSAVLGKNGMRFVVSEGSYQRSK